MFATYGSPAQIFRDGYKDRGRLDVDYANYGAFGCNPRAGASERAKVFQRLRGPVEGADHHGKPLWWFGTTLKAMGEEKDWRTAKVGPADWLRTGRNLLAQLVAAGEFKGALSGYSQTFEVMKPAGAPVDWVYLNPVFANIHPTGIAAKAPHPNAARLFIDFVLSKRGQEVIRGMNRIPDRIDTPPDQARLMENIKPAFAPAEVLDNFERYVKLFHEIFGGR